MVNHVVSYVVKYVGNWDSKLRSIRRGLLRSLRRSLLRSLRRSLRRGLQRSLRRGLIRNFIFYYKNYSLISSIYA